MLRQLSEVTTFLGEFRRTFYTTGAVLPSGKQLARAVCRPLREHAKPVRVLEVGPGTGAVTQEIVKHIRPGDQFDIVELNDRFVELLKKRFETEPSFKRVSEQSSIHHKPVQDLQVDQPYDVIISGLPVNNFPIGLVRELMRHLASLVAPHGTLSFFEYLAIRRMKVLVAGHSERRRLAGVGRVIEHYLRQYEFRCDTAWINFPPALIHHLRLDPPGGKESPSDSGKRPPR